MTTVALLDYQQAAVKLGLKICTLRVMVEAAFGEVG